MAETTCPFTTDEIKLHLKVSTAADDDLIEQIMLAATTLCENYQRRTYISRERVDHIDKFPRIIRPIYSPLVTVTTIKYMDIDGAEQTLAPANYRVDIDTEPGRITEAYDCDWPDTRVMTGAVEVTYQSGYGAVSTVVPDDIRLAIKMLIAHYYCHRESVSHEQMYIVPMGVRDLLEMRRLY